MLHAPLWLIILAGLVGAQSLDYQTYKANVEPIFLKKRPTHTRCVVCHASANHPFRLEPLNKGATTWTEAQSRKNFETASHLVKPGEPFSSLLLIQLAVWRERQPIRRGSCCHIAQQLQIG